MFYDDEQQNHSGFERVLHLQALIRFYVDIYIIEYFHLHTLFVREYTHKKSTRDNTGMTSTYPENGSSFDIPGKKKE